VHELQRASAPQLVCLPLSCQLVGALLVRQSAHAVGPEAARDDDALPLLGLAPGLQQPELRSLPHPDAAAGPLVAAAVAAAAAGATSQPYLHLPAAAAAAAAGALPATCQPHLHRVAAPAAAPAAPEENCCCHQHMWSHACMVVQHDMHS